MKGIKSYIIIDDASNEIKAVHTVNPDVDASTWILPGVSAGEDYITSVDEVDIKTARIDENKHRKAKKKLKLEFDRSGNIVNLPAGVLTIQGIDAKTTRLDVVDGVAVMPTDKNLYTVRFYPADDSFATAETRVRTGFRYLEKPLEKLKKREGR